eukprot:jgi/Mesvir1/78/Mv18013-RA.1
MSCEELGVSRSRVVAANEVRGDDAEDATVKTLTVAASDSIVLRPGAAPGSVVDVDGDAIVRGTLTGYVTLDDGKNNVWRSNSVMVTTQPCTVMLTLLNGTTSSVYVDNVLVLQSTDSDNSVEMSRAVFANEVRGDDAEDATVKTLTVAASESVVLRPGAAPGSVVDVDGDAIVRGTLTYSDAKEAYADLVDKSGFKPPEPETASEYVERVISRRLSVRKNEHSKAEQARAARQEADATKGLKRRPLGSIVMNQDASQQGAKQPLLKRKQPSPPAIMPRPQGLTPSTPTSSALSAAQEAQIAALYAQIDSIRSGGLASATFGAVSPPPPVPGFEVEPVADKAGSVVLAAVHCAGSRKRQ